MAHMGTEYVFAADEMDSDEVNMYIAAVKDELSLESECTGGLGEDLAKRMQALKTRGKSVSPVSSASLGAPAASLLSDDQAGTERGRELPAGPSTSMEIYATPTDSSVETEAEEVVAGVAAELAVELEFPSVPVMARSAAAPPASSREPLSPSPPRSPLRSPSPPPSSEYAALPEAEEVAQRITSTAAELNNDFRAPTPLQGDARGAGASSGAAQGLTIAAQEHFAAPLAQAPPPAAAACSAAAPRPSHEPVMIMSAVELIEDWFILPPH